MFCAKSGKTSVSAKIGPIMRQSRKLSRTSRRVTIAAFCSVSRRLCSPNALSMVALSMDLRVVAMFASRFFIFFNDLQIDRFKALLDFAECHHIHAMFSEFAKQRRIGRQRLRRGVAHARLA